jgi:hypothetical protein
MPPRRLNITNPINTKCPWNRGLVGNWMALPQLTGGVKWFDSCRVNNGTLTNMAFPATSTSGWGPPTRPGAFGELRLDGVDDYVTCSSVVGIPGNTSPITLTAYLTINAIAVGNNSAIFNLTTSGVRDYVFQIATIGATTYVATDGWDFATTITGSQIPSIGVPHMLSLTHDGAGNFKYYLDGILSKSFTVPVAAGTVDTVYIGARQSGATGYMDARFFSAAIHNVALSAGEIQGMYLNSCTGYRRTLNWIEPRRVYAVANGTVGGGLLGGGVGFGGYILGG